MANKTNPDNFLSWGKIFGDIKKLIFVSNITMRKSLLRKCFSLSAENIHKCEIIRTYIYSCAAGKRCLGTKKLSEALSHNCPLVVHFAVCKRKHQSVVQTPTDWLSHRNHHQGKILMRMLDPAASYLFHQWWNWIQSSMKGFKTTLT